MPDGSSGSALLISVIFTGFGATVPPGLTANRSRAEVWENHGDLSAGG